VFVLCCDVNAGGVGSSLRTSGARVVSEQLQGYRARTTVGPSTKYAIILCIAFEKRISCMATLPRRYLHLYSTPRPSL
jgi:hypothetical protein